jgi:hypothetical protein
MLTGSSHFAKKKAELKRKAVGNDTEDGREMVIVDENSKPRFRHRSKFFRSIVVGLV